jgi:hypothetical protein
VDAATPSKASSTSLPMRPAKPTLSVSSKRSGDKWASWRRGGGGTWGKAEIAEFLFRAPGRRVRFVHLFQQAKSLAEFSGNG